MKSSSVPVGKPADSLESWAFIRVISVLNDEGKEKESSGYTDLASMALEEKWYFGETPNPRRPYPISQNYLKYTFYRLRREGKVLESAGSPRRAVFNTGLVDKLYDPIFALFEANWVDGAQPWRLTAFCVPGKGHAGKQMTAAFDPLPEPAKYFGSNFDMLLDTSKTIHVDYSHVILDGARRGRFPAAFLKQHVPSGIKWQDYDTLAHVDRRRFLEELTAKIEKDTQCMRGIKGRLEDAKLLAEKRIRWNYKTAIPQYYPKFDSMSLLLPLALLDDEVVDVALIVSRNPSGSYQGRTVLPLDWAYQNARLVCRPDSDWLVPDAVKHEKEVLEEEVDEP